MTGTSHRLLRTGIAAAIAAAACWFWLPGSRFEQQAFRSLVAATGGTIARIDGNGTRTTPWKVTTRAGAHGDTRPPAIVTLDNDPDAIFSTFPHAPIDFAVILTNMHRLGARTLACAPLLAWDEPDPIGLTALESELTAFQSVALAVPITRGPVMQPLPDPLRRASVPLEDVHGDTSALPVVNRVSLPNLIYGGNNTIAGFSSIDSEPANDRIPLLARWDYRVVLGFPLLVAMQDLGLEPSQLNIRIGRFIQLGSDGPRIRIDEFGYMAAPRDLPEEPTTIPAESLIDAKPSRVSDYHFESVLFCDHRSNSDQTLLGFNRNLPWIVECLSHGFGRSTTRTYIRPIAASEVCSLITLCFVLAVLAGLGPWARIGSYLGIITAYAIAQYLSLIHFDLWLPGLPAAIATAAAALLSIGSNERPGVVIKGNDGLNYVRYSGQSPP